MNKLKLYYIYYIFVIAGLIEEGRAYAFGSFLIWKAREI